MSEVTRVHRRQSTPAGVFDAPSSRPPSLPAEVLAQSCRRVGLIALVGGSLWAFALFMNNVVQRWVMGSFPEMMKVWPWPGNLIGGTGLATALIMFWLAGRLRDRPQLLLDLGLCFEVVNAFLVGLLNTWAPVLSTPRISWVCVLILIYPTIAPSTPRRTFAAALAAASMDPLGLLIAELRGTQFIAPPFLVLWFVAPNYICALLAMLPHKVIRTLGQQVTRARELGSYQLGELLGAGGMGQVYRATHRMLARPAAIKLITPAAVSGGNAEEARISMERFRREAAVAATLRSPHTIELYDFGVTDDGTFYYAMELLDGVDFATLVTRFGPLPAERVVYLLEQACCSLEEAHTRGFIHRDVKPSNLYTCRMGLAVDFVKVLDFGLVKSESPMDRDQVTLTAPNVVTGTPAFMAPESVSAEHPVDHRVDIYAFGCVAYWLLTGRMVFQESNPVKLLLHHLNTEPLPPSRQTELPIPGQLDALVLDCLAKQPDNRPPNFAEVRRRLASVELAEHWIQERAKRWWQIHLPAGMAPPSPSVVGPPVASPEWKPRIYAAPAGGRPDA